MITAPSLLTVFKYGFLTMVVSSAGYLIGNVIVLKHHKAELLDDLVYKRRTSRSAEGVQPLLDRDFRKCWTHPTIPFCRMSVNKQLHLLRDKGHHSSDLDDSQSFKTFEHEDSTSVGPRRRHPLHDLLVDLTQLMASLHMRPVLLDPPMLFCVLSPSNKYALLKKNFNPTDRMGPRNVLTVGISQEESKFLDHANASAAFLGAGFDLSRVRKFLEPDIEVSVRFLLIRNKVAIQVLVFFERRTFLWYPEVSTEDIQFPDLLYATAGAFENFTAMPLRLENAEDLDIYLPNDPIRFLLQIKDSKFLTCRNASASIPPKTHPSLTDDQVEKRAIVAIQELQVLLHPYFVKFWLWTQSLVGWLEDCNIFGRSYELNFAIFDSAVEGLNLTALFANNEYLKLLDHTRLEDKNVKILLECFGLRVNLFLCFEEGNTVGCYVNTDHRERMVYRMFQLCSAETLGQRVLVPCEVELIVKAEASAP